MATYKCRKCGAELTPQADGVTAVCEYCDSVLRLPKVDPALFNRATELRQERKFDQAAALFRQCVSQDPQDSESHWNLLLCKFGVEYVEEKDGTRVPTCNGITYDPITEDEDYLDAIRFADELSARMYAEEGARITAIQQEIIRLANQGESYDVFISYKESDEQGARTEDSVIAQEIYDALEKKGYKVFLSRVTLKGQAGLKYEPIIFSALNSATVMILVGTSNERMEAVWVSNEWKRFLHLMEEDKEKKLEVVYKDMKRIDLPPRLRFMPQRDISAAGRYGWQQDVAYDVDSMIGSRKKQAVPETGYIRETDEQANERTIRNFYLRAEQELEKDNTSSAKKYLEQALDIDMNRAETWWRLLQLEISQYGTPTGKSPTPSDEILKLIDKVFACPMEQEILQPRRAEIDKLLEAWRYAYGNVHFRNLKASIGSQDPYSDSHQRTIPQDYKKVREYAAPDVTAQAKSLYERWSGDLPEFKKAQTFLSDYSGVLTAMRKQDSTLNESINGLDKIYARFNKLNSRPIRFCYLDIVYILYLAIAPIIMVFFSKNEESMFGSGIYSIGSVILFVLFILAKIIFLSGPRAGGDFVVVHGLTCLFFFLSVAMGIIVGWLKVPLIRLLGTVYGMDLYLVKNGSKITYHVDEITELVTKFQGSLNKFLVILAISVVFSLLASIFMSIRIASIDKLQDSLADQRKNACIRVRHVGTTFFQPYTSRFGTKSFHTDGIVDHVQNVILKRFVINRKK